MATPVNVTAANPDNGTPSVKPVVADNRAAIRAATLAELEKMPAADADEATSSQAPATTHQSEQPDAAPDSDEPGPDLSAEAAPEQPKLDPANEKGLAAIQKAEKRQREAIAQAKAEAQAEIARMRAELEAERSSLNPLRAELEQFKQLRERARYDFDAAAQALGLTEDDYEPLARNAYARSKAGQANPANREQAARLLKDRELADKYSALETKLAAMEKAQAEAAQAAKHEAQQRQYTAALEKAVSDETPLVRNMFGKNPDKARAEMQRVAATLYQQTGEVPDPSDVMSAYEKIRRNELEDLGLDVDTFLKQSTKTKSPVAAETKPAKTLSNDLSTSTVPRSALPDDRQSRRSQMIRELQALEDSRAE